MDGRAAGLVLCCVCLASLLPSALGSALLRRTAKASPPKALVSKEQRPRRLVKQPHGFRRPVRTVRGSRAWAMAARDLQGRRHTGDISKMFAALEYADQFPLNSKFYCLEFQFTAAPFVTVHVGLDATFTSGKACKSASAERCYLKTEGNVYLSINLGESALGWGDFFNFGIDGGFTVENIIPQGKFAPCDDSVGASLKCDHVRITKAWAKRFISDKLFPYYAPTLLQRKLLGRKTQSPLPHADASAQGEATRASLMLIEAYMKEMEVAPEKRMMKNPAELVLVQLGRTWGAMFRLRYLEHLMRYADKASVFFTLAPVADVACSDGQCTLTLPRGFDLAAALGEAHAARLTVAEITVEEEERETQAVLRFDVKPLVVPGVLTNYDGMVAAKRARQEMPLAEKLQTFYKKHNPAHLKDGKIEEIVEEMKWNTRRRGVLDPQQLAENIEVLNDKLRSKYKEDLDSLFADDTAPEFLRIQADPHLSASESDDASGGSRQASFLFTPSSLPGSKSNPAQSLKEQYLWLVRFVFETSLIHKLMVRHGTLISGDQSGNRFFLDSCSSFDAFVEGDIRGGDIEWVAEKNDAVGMAQVRDETGAPRAYHFVSQPQFFCALAKALALDENERATAPPAAGEFRRVFKRHWCRRHPDRKLPDGTTVEGDCIMTKTGFVETPLLPSDRIVAPFPGEEEEISGPWFAGRAFPKKYAIPLVSANLFPDLAQAAIAAGEKMQSLGRFCGATPEGDGEGGSPKGQSQRLKAFKARKCQADVKAIYAAIAEFVDALPRHESVGTLAPQGMAMLKQWNNAFGVLPKKDVDELCPQFKAADARFGAGSRTLPQGHCCDKRGVIGSLFGADLGFTFPPCTKCMGGNAGEDASGIPEVGCKTVCGPTPDSAIQKDPTARAGYARHRGCENKDMAKMVTGEAFRRTNAAFHKMDRLLAKMKRNEQEEYDKEHKAGKHLVGQINWDLHFDITAEVGSDGTDFCTPDTNFMQIFYQQARSGTMTFGPSASPASDDEGEEDGDGNTLVEFSKELLIKIHVTGDLAVLVHLGLDPSTHMHLQSVNIELLFYATGLELKAGDDLQFGDDFVVIAAAMTELGEWVGKVVGALWTTAHQAPQAGGQHTTSRFATFKEALKKQFSDPGTKEAEASGGGFGAGFKSLLGILAPYGVMAALPELRSIPGAVAGKVVDAIKMLEARTFFVFQINNDANVGKPGATTTSAQVSLLTYGKASSPDAAVKVKGLLQKGRTFDVGARIAQLEGMKAGAQQMLHAAAGAVAAADASKKLARVLAARPPDEPKPAEEEDFGDDEGYTAPVKQLSLACRMCVKILEEYETALKQGRSSRPLSNVCRKLPEVQQHLGPGIVCRTMGDLTQTFLGKNYFVGDDREPPGQPKYRTHVNGPEPEGEYADASIAFQSWEKGVAGPWGPERADRKLIPFDEDPELFDVGVADRLFSTGQTGCWPSDDECRKGKTKDGEWEHDKPHCARAVAEDMACRHAHQCEKMGIACIGPGGASRLNVVAFGELSMSADSVTMDEVGGAEKDSWPEEDEKKKE